MGVPKFFRYMSERYPCLSELIKENQIPEFDNLYLDMNGIIHNCSHPNDMDVHYRITEEQIFKNIFHYIDMIFRMIEPQKLFFMAVDGVAPRAKMNQQRARRFRSAKDAEVLELKAKNKGEVLPTDDRFDSNCITPGTPFMCRLQEALKYFIQYKITTNPIWKKCRIVLSGHETPGEGEHKIMDFIRYLKAQPDFDANTRHCLYGLDADLIMLGLCTHEHHFALLREEVKFGRQAKRPSSVDETKFYLLHLGLLKEYLELEFSAVKDKINFDFNMENIVDDWILMGFLVGNDFIPHLPNLHISSNALPLLYETYIKALPQCDGYINVNGTLNLKRFEVFMRHLGDVDRKLFKNMSSDLRFANEDMSAFDFDPSEIEKDDDDLIDFSEFADKGLEDLIKSSQIYDEEELSEEALTAQEFTNHKRNYYINKMNYTEVNSDVLKEQTECYIRAIQWTLSYYYHGVQSWSWFYPHHYAPYISDVQNFKDLKLNFDIGKPFLPFEQLMAVLPAGSKALLPKPYRRLMTDPSSPIVDFYPEDFTTDLNGKTHDWEAVVLLPFIDENKLLTALSQCQHELTEEEKRRNAHGPMFSYEYSKTSKYRLPGQFGLVDLEHTFTKETAVTLKDVHVPIDKLVFGPSTSKSDKHVYYPGFPTMKHLKYSSELVKSRVRVFDNASRNDNMIIKILFDDSINDDPGKIVENLVGKEIFIDWPHLIEAKVIQVSNIEKVWLSVNKTQENTAKSFDIQAKQIKEHYMGRLGIDTGMINTLVHVLPLKGREYCYGSMGKMVLTKIWGDKALPYPIQTIVSNIDSYCPKFLQYQDVEQVFTQKSTVFLLSSVFYGNRGEVLDASLVRTCGRIQVLVKVYHEPNFNKAREVHNSTKDNYVNSHTAASIIGISVNLFSRITGSILVVPGMKRSNLPENTSKLNIGLQLKFVKYNEEVIGFTKKQQNFWLYSRDAIKLVQDYLDKFPMLFENISKFGNNMDFFFESDLFPNNVGDNMMDLISKWIKEQPHAQAERIPGGTILIEKETLHEVINEIAELEDKTYKKITLQIKPHLLYKPELRKSSRPPDPKAYFRLFDRVIMVRDLHVVPLGYRGTIIGIHRVAETNPIRQENLKTFDTLYDVLFDKSFDDGNSMYQMAENRIYRVSENTLINISYGLNRSESNSSNQDGQTQSNSWRKPLNLSLSSTVNSASASANIQDKPSKSIAVKPTNVVTAEKSKTIDTSSKSVETEILKKMLGLQVSDTDDRKLSTKVSNKDEHIIKIASRSQSNNVAPPAATVQEHNKGNVSAPQFVPQQSLLTNRIMSNTTDHQNSQSISLEKVFAAHTLTKGCYLPPPPQNWKQDLYIRSSDVALTNSNNPSSSYNQQPSNGFVVRSDSIPLTNHQQPQQPHAQIVQPPQSLGTYYHRPQAIPLNTSNNFKNNLETTKRPNGPQNLSNNVAFPAGHGAFIPLQAIRNNKKQNTIEQSSTIRQHTNSGHSNKSNKGGGGGGHKNNEGTARENSNKNTSNNKPRTDFKPRSSRLAARFNNAPSGSSPD